MRVFLSKSGKKPQNWVWRLCIVGGAIRGCQCIQKLLHQDLGDAEAMGPSAIAGEVTQSAVENEPEGHVGEHGLLGRHWRGSSEAQHRWHLEEGRYACR